jgi:CheY-like chemotaxis protein
VTKTKRILLVDDDPAFVEANKELLEAEGYVIDTAADGASGVAKAKAQKPDLMILDVMMACDTEGFDVSREVAKIPQLKDMPVIILTGIRRAKKLPFGFEPDDTWLPVKAVLEKPVPPEKLLEAVAKYTS